MNDSKICRDATREFGADNRKLMAIKKCAELTDVLIRERVDIVADDDVIAKIADVQIMCEQLAQMYGRRKVREERYRKLRRLEVRIRKTIEYKEGLFG